MDPPADDIDLKPEKLEEEKESGPLFHCDFFDMDIVYKVGQALLPGLASACIDNTIGGLFKTPASVAVDLRREMVDYLIQRSENFVAESVVLEGGPDVDVSVDPYDIISDFVDDFVTSKRNFFSRVSGWLLSEKREDWIDDLVQEMEINGFWLLNRRNAVAQTLLKNLDFKNLYHCSMSFKTEEDLEKHKPNCGFRTMTCENEGCDSSFSAAQMDHHDLVCPFKILPCEQNCPDSIMRREMDRHCITICPMKLVKCPFYSVGCQSTIPQSTIEQHKSESLSSHVLCILQGIHKGASLEDLNERAQELDKASSPGQLASARDARSLTNVIKRLEAKLGPLKVHTKAQQNEEDTDSTDKKEETVNSMPKKHVRFENLPTEKEETVNSNSEVHDHEEPPHEKGEPVKSSTSESAESQTNDEKAAASVSVQEKTLNESPEDIGSHSKGGDHKDSSHEKENVSAQSQTNDEKAAVLISAQEENPKESDIGSPTKVDEQMGKLSKEENLNESPIQKKEDLGSPVQKKEDLDSPVQKKEDFGSPVESKEDLGSLTQKKEDLGSPVQKEEDLGSPVESKEDLGSPTQKKEDLGSPIKLDVQMEKLSKEEMVIDPIKEEDSATLTVKQEQLNESIVEGEKHVGSTARNEVSTKSPPGEKSLVPN